MSDRLQKCGLAKKPPAASLARRVGLTAAWSMQRAFSPRPLVDVGEIARMLNARIRELAPVILPHGKRDGHEFRCGSLAGEQGDSLAVHLSGAKAGIWCDFATGETGDALDLVAQARYGGNKHDALTWARGYLGIDDARPAQLAAAREAAVVTDQQAAAEAAQTRSNGMRIWLAARPSVRDTPVDAYLAGRGIELAKMGRQPRALRFHPDLWHKGSDRHWPAMVTAITAADGSFCAVHRTWLDVTGSTVRKAAIEPNKMVLGGYRGAAIRLWRGAGEKTLARAGPDEIVDITEGIEDGLSVAYACGECRVLAAVSVSNMGTLTLPPQIRTVRLWRQNDTAPAAIAAFARAVAAHQAAGRTVLIPEIPDELKDVNDLVQLDG
jgi:hypothetical protein